jgi:S-DNA-T family DNA segregation ATPase FtsK/SpoIIIE
MESRYTLLREGGERNIADYNAKFLSRRLNPNKGHHFMPYIVVVIDEFADMIMTAGKEVEIPITRLAQKARAVGIHLIVATQRPDVKVITGLIKSNIPARMAFKVVSMVDSRTIIDQPGANNLLGMGDMLMMKNGELTRIQCAFIDTPEIERIVTDIGKQQSYPSAYELPDYVPESTETNTSRETMGRMDEKFEEIARWVVESQEGSTSAIQRRFEIGYNRAGRITDQLEKAGIVGKSNGPKPREVLIYDVAVLDRLLLEIL